MPKVVIAIGGNSLIPDADHTFSTRKARRAFLDAALEWVEGHSRQA